MHREGDRKMQSFYRIVVEKQCVLDSFQSPQRQRQLQLAGSRQTVSVLLQQIKAGVTLQASVLN